MNRSVWIGLLASLVGMALVAPAAAQQQKPNILVIMADDIGYWNISAYNRRGSLADRSRAGVGLLCAMSGRQTGSP